MNVCKNNQERNLNYQAAPIIEYVRKEKKIKFSVVSGAIFFLRLNEYPHILRSQLTV